MLHFLRLKNGILPLVIAKINDFEFKIRPWFLEKLNYPW